jgi:hypothetical protein
VSHARSHARAVALAPLAVAALALAPARAAAGPVAAVIVQGEAPCTRDELVSALALRVGDRPVTVRFEAGRAWLELAGRVDVVELDGATGRDAARRIALAAAALAVDELKPGAPAPAAPARVALAAPTGDAEAELRDDASPATTARRAWTVAARVSSSAAVRTAGAVGVELGGRRVRLGLELGLASGAADAMDGVRVLATPARACAVSGGDVAVRACALVVPLWVDGGAGDRGVLVGGSLAGTGRAVVDGVELIYQVGVDAHANQLDYRWSGAPVLTTPWLAVWTGVGVRWEGGP